MNNKYIYIFIILVIVVGLGIGYKKFIKSDSSQPVTTGKVREVTITTKKDEWKFVPDTIEADQGDLIKLTVINEDEYDHGIAIDAFGVSQRIPAKGTIKINFVVTQPGDFPFYCSVPCGEGEVEGKPRGHFDQVGKIHVRTIVVPESNK